MTLRSIALALFALFALAIVACGDDDSNSGNGFELPPAGDYVFDVAGTMEVEFPAEGVSAAAARLQQTETGDVSGSLTSILEGNELTILELGFTVVFGGNTVEFRAAGPESTGTVGPEGTTLTLNLDATTLDGQSGTSNDYLLETDDFFPGPPLNLAPPDGWGPLPFADESGNELLTVNDFALIFSHVERSADDPSSDDPPLGDDPIDDEPTSFTDPEGDDVICGSDEPANNPTVDITGVNFFGPPENFRMEVVMGASPMDAFDNDNSTSVGGYVGEQGAISENHEKQARVGLFDPDGNLLPGSEQDVTIGDESVSFNFAGPPPPPGTSWNVEAFNQAGPNDPVACDTAEGTWP